MGIIILNCFEFLSKISFQDDENLLPELEADVKEECNKLGPVESVRVSLITKLGNFLFSKMCLLALKLALILHSPNFFSHEIFKVAE